MKHLITLFENFFNEDDISEILDFLKNEYPIRNQTLINRDVKYIIIDEKPLYMIGNKTHTRRKLFYEIKDNFKDTSDASINKAIKIYLNS